MKRVMWIALRVLGWLEQCPRLARAVSSVGLRGRDTAALHPIRVKVSIHLLSAWLNDVKRRPALSPALTPPGVIF